MLINGINIQPVQFILVFLAVLFIYLQIQFHYKIAPEDADIYELTQELPKKQFDKVCDHDRIPFVFNFYETPAIMQFINTIDYTTCNKAPIHIRAVGGVGAVAAPKFKRTTFITGMETLGSDPNTAAHVSERNIEFLKAIHIPAFLKRRDLYLRPAMCQFIDYDLLFGSYMAATPLRYEINQRTFFTVVSGVINIRLVHPVVAAAEFRPNEEPNIDNVLMEYRSAANIWAPNTARRIQCIHLTIPAGKTVYIPPFWWYSILFPAPGATTRVLRFSYRNIINSMVLAPYFISHKLYAFSDLDDADATPIRHTKLPVSTPTTTKKKKRTRSQVTFTNEPPILVAPPPPPMQTPPQNDTPLDMQPSQSDTIPLDMPMPPMQPPLDMPPQSDTSPLDMPPLQSPLDMQPPMQSSQSPLDMQPPMQPPQSPLDMQPPIEDPWTNKKHSNKFEQLMQQFNSADIDL